MSWADAAAMAGPVIDATFAEPTKLVYTGAGLVAGPIDAIRIDEGAPDSDSLRQVVYEIRQVDLPGTPVKGDHGDHFTHRGRLWRLSNITRRDDIGKWEIVCIDSGPQA